MLSAQRGGARENGSQWSRLPRCLPASLSLWGAGHGQERVSRKESGFPRDPGSGGGFVISIIFHNQDPRNWGEKEKVAPSIFDP